jgi:hypothetical protein
MAIDLAEQLEATEPTRPVATYRTDLIMTLLGGWFTIGLFLDAWAHNNIPGLETFFTPWHAVFYSGFTATAAWVLWTCRRALPDGQRALRAIPVGYAPTIVALAAFAIGGVADLTWHQVFGIEQNIDILFSPTHLILIASMLVIVTTPIRSAWANASLPPAPGLRLLLPVVLSMAFATTLVLLFLQYANALTYSSPGVVRSLSTGHNQSTEGFVAAVAVTNVVLALPLLTLARRWRLPVGTATIVYLAVCVLSCAVTGLRNVPLIVGVMVAAVCVDILAVLLRPGPDSLARFRSFGGFAALLTWTIYIVTAYATSAGVRVIDDGGGQASAKPELYIGVAIVQALVGVLLAVLLIPSGTPTRLQGR